MRGRHVSTLDEQIVQHKWLAQLCPIVNGVIYGTGEITLFSLIGGFQLSGTSIELRRGIRTCVTSFLEQNPDDWTSVTSLCEATSDELNARVLAGEAGLGADGFVAVTRKNDEYLEWIMFFENSNPFIEVTINGPDIVAVTNLGDRWTIPLRSPENMSVETQRRSAEDSL